MSAVLTPLSNSAHVIAAAIFDGHGRCVESHLPPPYDPILINDMIARLSEAFEFFSALGHVGGARCFAADCESGSVITRQIANSTIVAFVEQAGNMAMINVALNVVGLKLRRQGEASQSGSDRFMMPSSSASLSHSGSFIQGVGMVDRAALRRMLKLYQLEVGPAAKLLLKQELTRLGLSARALRTERYPSLVQAISTRIPGEDPRRIFVEQALKLVPQDSTEF